MLGKPVAVIRWVRSRFFILQPRSVVIGYRYERHVMPSDQTLRLLRRDMLEEKQPRSFSSSRKNSQRTHFKCSFHHHQFGDPAASFLVVIDRPRQRGRLSPPVRVAP